MINEHAQAIEEVIPKKHESCERSFLLDVRNARPDQSDKTGESFVTSFFS